MIHQESFVHEAKKGSQEAFAKLIAENEKKVYNLAYRMTGNPQDALDISQEAFLKAWQALPNFKEESSFSTWLYRLTSNTAIDFLRKQQRIPQQIQTPEDSQPIELQIPDTAPTPSQALEQKEITRSIQKGLELLPPHHRDVLILREVQGLSYQEIAKTLDLDLGTVKSRIARGRITLRDFLLKENITPSP